MSAHIDAAWLRDDTVQAVLRAVSGAGEEARVVGGAVRNHMLGLPITDIDIATTCLPQDTAQRGQAAGFKTVPTGIDHGTVTLVANGRPFEVTTLRHDTEPDGRRARVVFGRDWRQDAERRDFTINALYVDAGGAVLDLVGGLADLSEGRLRFIGQAEDRIREDYLRALRFFRFYAWYGKGRPDAEALRAVTQLKDGLAKLSAERVAAELGKLLTAPDPSRALLWMRQTGVLTAILPESERWGIDAIHGLVAAEAEHGWDADPVLRLMAIVPPDEARLTEMARRLRFSNAWRKRLQAFARMAPLRAEFTQDAFRSLLQETDRQAIRDRLRLDLAGASARGDAAGAASLERLAALMDEFEPLAFPVSGEDVQAAGVPAGKPVGEALTRLRRLWLDGGMRADREALLAALADADAKTGP